ncbi:MAG: alginate export family protein [Bdellovibrionota bacterium]
MRPTKRRTLMVCCALASLFLAPLSAVAQGEPAAVSAPEEKQSPKQRLEQLEEENKDFRSRIESLELFRKEAFKQERQSAWADRFTLGIQARSRFEGRFNYDRDSDVGDKDGFVLLRARLHALARATEDVKAFVQIQGSQVYGGVATDPAVFGPGNSLDSNTDVLDNEGVSIHQAYAELTCGDCLNFSLRLGRQEMRFGDERLVGALDWVNRARSFDGVSLLHTTKPHKTQIFFDVIRRRENPDTPPIPPAPVSQPNDSFFAGFYNSAPQFLGGFDYYTFVYWDGDGTTQTSPADDADLVIAAFGLRNKNIPKEGFGYDLEAVYQAGENDAAKIRAFAVHSALAYTFESDLSPQLLAEYNVASGEKDPATQGDEDNQFQNLFPTNHGKYGHIDFVSWSNLHHVKGAFSIVPTEGLSLAAEYHEFFAYEPSGAIGVAPSAITAAPARTERHFGREVDFVWKWRWRPEVLFLGGYSLFLPGKMFTASSLKGDPVHFAYTMISVEI